MKADEHRYWQSRPVHERLDAVEETIQTAYALKGWEIGAALHGIRPALIDGPRSTKGPLWGTPLTDHVTFRRLWVTSIDDPMADDSTKIRSQTEA